MGNGYSRLTEPLIPGNGEFRTATWDEALDRVATGLRGIMDEHPDGRGVFSCPRRPTR